MNFMNFEAWGRQKKQKPIELFDVEKIYRSVSEFKDTFEKRLKTNVKGGNLNFSAIDHALNDGFGIRDVANSLDKVAEYNDQHKNSSYAEELRDFARRVRVFPEELEEWHEVEVGAGTGDVDRKALRKVRDFLDDFKNFA